MASYLDKAQINTALTNNCKLDLGHTHISTADFFQLNVDYIHEMVPGEKIDVAMESFARLNPLPVPTFGRASMRNRAFFVPFRTIFRGWSDFITDNVHIASDGYNGTAPILSVVPTIEMSDLAGAFKNSIGTSSTDNAMLYPSDDVAIYDVSWSGGNDFYNFTVRGRQCIKLLEQLGYKIDFNAKAGDCKLSALPLLALSKIFADWYYPSQYKDISTYDRLLSLCNYDVSSGLLQLTSTDVMVILRICSYVMYDSDYFVSAWDQPNSPNALNYSNFKLVNIDTMSHYFSSEANASLPYGEIGYVSNNSGTPSATDRVGYANAPFIVPMLPANNNKDDVSTPISEYLLHSLHSLTDYLKRHQLAGASAFDRYLARFGKALPAEKLNRSLYLGAAIQDIQIGDVMSTADTEGAQLGAYSGKGITYGNGHFDYNTEEFGYFIIVSTIIPAAGYYQGIDRQVMRTTKLEFFTPEFDSLGVQAITKPELYVPQLNGDMTGAVPYDGVFGFTPRYADYKVSRDQLTGNFRLNSLNQGVMNAQDSWHLMRSFDGDDFLRNWNFVIHSPQFMSGDGDVAQYKRIFYNTNDDAPDNFTVIHNFEIAAYAPMKPLYDEYEFEDKGKKVTMEVSGVKMN